MRGRVIRTARLHRAVEAQGRTMRGAAARSFCCPEEVGG